MSNVIKLSHGSGGVETSELIERMIFSRVADRLKRVGHGVGIDFPDDAAAVPLPDGKYLVVSIDSYTVSPIFFPGGDIGVLAASGTINDVLMMGGRPIAVLDSVVVEEGLPMEVLDRVLSSFLKVLEGEGVALIGGDFKVMPKGQLDKIVITTAGLGIADRVIKDMPKSGDKIIVSDYVGDHGAVIMALRYGIKVGEGFKSDVKPLTSLMLPLLEKYGEYVHAARDPTRGGLAMVLNDWAKSSDKVIVLEEDKVPIRRETLAYAEMTGIDPLYLASEGVAVLSVESEVADEVVDFMHKLGFTNARIVGEVREGSKYRGIVLYKTVVGGFRILEPPRGDLVPRIC